MKGLRLAYLSAVLNAVIIGFSFLFAKMALESAGPVDILAWRFAVSFAVLSLPVLFGRVRLGSRRLPPVPILLLAALYPIGFFVFQTFGLLHATSSEGGILYAATPVITMLLASLFLGETTTLLQKLSIGLSAAGVVYIFWMKGSGIALSHLAGISLLLLSCAAFAGYSVLARSLLKTYSTLDITYMMQGIGFVVFMIWSFTEHAAAGTLDKMAAPLADGSFLVSVLYLGILSSLVTSLMANFALSRMEASRMSVFSNLSTVVSIMAGALVLGEEVRLYHVAGSLLILAGVMGTNLFRAKVPASRILVPPQIPVQETER